MFGRQVRRGSRALALGFIVYGRQLGVNWVAVKELKLSYYIGETLLFAIYTHDGTLI